MRKAWKVLFTHGWVFPTCLEITELEQSDRIIGFLKKKKQPRDWTWGLTYARQALRHWADIFSFSSLILKQNLTRLTRLALTSVCRQGSPWPLDLSTPASRVSEVCAIRLNPEGCFSRRTNGQYEHPCVWPVRRLLISSETGTKTCDYWTVLEEGSHRTITNGIYFAPF